MWFYQKLFGFDTHPDGIYMKEDKKVRSNLIHEMCIEPLRWGGVWKIVCHVTQKKCDGGLFGGNWSERINLSISGGFIKSYLALIPIRTAFI